MKLIVISLGVFTLCTAIRVPTSWTSTSDEYFNNDRQPAVNHQLQRVPVHLQRITYPHGRPSVKVVVRDVPHPLDLAHRKYLRNKNNIKQTIPLANTFPIKDQVILHPAITDNRFNKHDYRPFKPFNTISQQNFKPVHENFNNVPENTVNRPRDELRFLPLPQPVDEEELAYQKEKEKILLQNHRDDETHEPVNEEIEEQENDEEEVEEEHYENDEDAPEVESEEEEENAPISDHEAPSEVPTRPIYPGEGQWAQKGVKHQPYVSSHKFSDLEDDNEEPEGYEIFDKLQGIFEDQSSKFENNLDSFPRKHKLGNYIKPTEVKSQPIRAETHKEQHNEEDDEEEEFVPTQIYTQVRKTEDEKHLPPILEGPHKLREVIKDSKIQTVYTEEGYEDIAYDHAGHEKEAAENEGFAEAEEEIQREKLKKAPKLKFKNEPSDDSSIEESNFDHGKSVVSPNGDSISIPVIRHKTTEKPKVNIKNNNHFMKTKEIKTTAVKDSDINGEGMEVVSKVKITMTPDKSRNKMKKIVEVTPKKYKLPKKYYPPSNSTKENVLKVSNNSTPDEKTVTTLEPIVTASPETIPGVMPLPTTSTEPLSKVVSQEKPATIEDEIFKAISLSIKENANHPDDSKTAPRGSQVSRKRNISARKNQEKVSRKKRFANDFEKFEIDTSFIDKINHNLPAKIDTTPQKYPYYFDRRLEVTNPHSPLRYSENMKNIPIKIFGEMTFYEQAQESVPCEEVETDVNPVPERVENAEKNAEEMKESDDVAELAESPRLKGLGDKIKCFKKRYFGENPLDSPFFREDLVDPVTPPYNMMRAFPKSTIKSIDKLILKNLRNHTPNKPAQIEKQAPPSSQQTHKTLSSSDESLTENASTISEEKGEDKRNDDGISTEENEVNIDDPEKILKENLTDLETFEEDIDIADEMKPNHGEFDSHIRGTPIKEIKSNLNNDGPIKFVLNLEHNIESIEMTKPADISNIYGSNFEGIVPEKKLNSKPNNTDNKIHDEVITLHPDAEFVNVDKLPEPTTPEPILNIITTPKYTIDLVPKHIYDQIELLRYLPGQSDSSTIGIIITKPDPGTEKENENPAQNSAILEENQVTFNETARETEDSKRQPKILVLENSGEINSQENSNVSHEENDNKPESLPLRMRNNRRKFRRKRPYVVFDVNRFWPTTPYPLFKQPPTKVTTAMPKHKVHSEVHYKEDIKPSEQLNVLRDVLTIIRNSSLQEPLMVAESSRVTRPVFNNIQIPIRSPSYNGIPYYPFEGTLQKNIFEQQQNNKYYIPTIFHSKPVKQFENPQVVTKTSDSEEELSTKLKIPILTNDQTEEQDEIDYYTNQELQKIMYSNQDNSSKKEKIPKRKKPVEPTVSSSDLSTISAKDSNKKSSNEESIDYIQEPMTEVLGLVPPGKNQYRTIYKVASPHKQPTSIYSVIEESPINKFYVEGMKPPPKNQKASLYPDLKLPLNKSRRRNHKHRRSRRQVKPNYTELVRSRGPQYQPSEESSKTEEIDDYVPHRPKNYHYDEKTGRIVYDKSQKDSEEEEDDVEYAVVYEQVTQKPKKSKATTESWIATAKPNKDEPSLLFYIDKLKKHPDYKLIPDPTTTEKGKESEQISSTTSVPLSTTPPAFLSILAKVKADSHYKLIPDKTTSKPKKTTTTEAYEKEEVVEESKIEDEEESEEEIEEEKPLSGLIFDISEFLPKTRNYQPRTRIDYSKYKTIERPHVNARHNLSSRYNADSDEKLEEVNTKKVPIIQTTGPEIQHDVSESRLEEDLNTNDQNQDAGNRRRSFDLGNLITTEDNPSTISAKLVSNTITISDDSQTATSPATLESSSSEQTSSITKETTPTTTTTQRSVSTKRIRIRGRTKTFSPKKTIDRTVSSTTAKSPSIDSNDEKPKDTLYKHFRRRPSRLRTATEKFFEPSDLDSPAKAVQRRQLYYNNHEPYRFDPVLLGDKTALRTTTTRKPQIRRRPRIRINTNNDPSHQSIEITTRRIPTTIVPSSESPVRRRQRPTRTRLRVNNAPTREPSTTESPRQVLVTTNTPSVRIRSRINRIDTSNTNLRSPNRVTYVPEVSTTSEPIRYTPEVYANEVQTTESSQIDSGSRIYTIQSDNVQNTPEYVNHHLSDSITRYTPAVLQNNGIPPTQDKAILNAEKQQVFNVGISSSNTAAYSPLTSTTPQPFRYTPSNLNSDLKEFELAQKRNDDTSNIEIPLPRNTATYISTDISTSQPPRFRAFIDDSTNPTPLSTVSSDRDGVDLSALNRATYYSTIPSTAQPFKYTESLLPNANPISKESSSEEDYSGLPDGFNYKSSIPTYNFESRETPVESSTSVNRPSVNISPESGQTYYPTESTTRIPFSIPSIYVLDRGNNAASPKDDLSSPLGISPSRANFVETKNTEIPSPKVETYFNSGTSASGLPLSSSTPRNQPQLLIQPIPKSQEEINRQGPGLIDIPPPSDAYLDKYSSTPLPSTVGRIINRNVPRPTEHPSIPVRRRGKVFRDQSKIIEDVTPNSNSYISNDNDDPRLEHSTVRTRNQRGRQRNDATHRLQQQIQYNIPVTESNVRHRIPDSPNNQNTQIGEFAILPNENDQINAENIQPKKINVDIYKNYDLNNEHGGNYKDSKYRETQNEQQPPQVIPTNQQAPGIPENVPEKSNVEVYKHYDKNQQHGGNYKEEDEIPDVVHSGTISPRTRILNSERVHPKKVDVGTLKNFDPKHRSPPTNSEFEDGSARLLEPGYENIQSQRIITTPEVIGSSEINTGIPNRYETSYNQRGNIPEPGSVDAIRSNNNNNNRFESNYRTSSRLTDSRNGQLSQSPEKVTPKTITYEVFDSYKPKQLSDASYEGKIDPGLIEPIRRDHIARIPPGQQDVPSQKVNVEVLKKYDSAQRHGGNYKSEDADAELVETENVHTKDGNVVIGPEGGQPAQATQSHTSNDGLSNDAHTTGDVKDPKVSELNLAALPILAYNDEQRFNIEILKPYLPAPRPQVRDQSDQIMEINRLNVELLKPYLPATRSHENYSKEVQEQKEVQPSTSQPQRRRRPSTTANSHPEVNHPSRNRNPQRRRGPKSVRNNSVANRNNIVQQNRYDAHSEQGKIEQRQYQNPPSDVEVFKPYDERQKHGGNYKPVGTNPGGNSDVEVFKPYDESKRHGGNYYARNPAQIRNLQVTSSKTPTNRGRETTTERLINKEVVKPYSNDPKLVKKINLPKDIRTANRNNIVQQNRYDAHSEQGKTEQRQYQDPSSDVEVFKPYDERQKHAGNYKPAGINPGGSSDVEVFKPYDESKRHGGNYRPLNPAQIRNLQVTSSKNPINRETEVTTERLITKEAVKPYYNDPKLAKNINLLKDIRIPETVTEDIVRDVQEEEEREEEEEAETKNEDEEYGWINLDAIAAPTRTTTSIPLPIPTSKAARTPNVIKDPSKRLYFYAAV